MLICTNLKIFPYLCSMFRIYFCSSHFSHTPKAGHMTQNIQILAGQSDKYIIISNLFKETNAIIMMSEFIKYYQTVNPDQVQPQVGSLIKIIAIWTYIKQSPSLGFIIIFNVIICCLCIIHTVYVMDIVIIWFWIGEPIK